MLHHEINAESMLDVIRSAYASFVDKRNHTYTNDWIMVPHEVIGMKQMYETLTGDHVNLFHDGTVTAGKDATEEIGVCYSVQVLLDGGHGGRKELPFLTLEEARSRFFKFSPYYYPDLYMYQPDGIRIRLSWNHPDRKEHKHGKLTDYSMVKDIQSMSCRQLKIDGDNAYLKYLLATAHYKFDKASGYWKFVDVR